MTWQLNAEQLKVLDLPAVTWPITWLYHYRLPWGRTQQELTVDAPDAAGNLDMSMKLGLEVWSRSIAPAMTHPCELLGWDTVAWRFAPAGLPSTAFGARGTALGAPSPRCDTPCIVLHTGHDDNLARRRFFVPGAPAAWSADRLVTEEGWRNLLTWSRGIYMGLAAQHTGGPMQWLTCYPELLAASDLNPNGVAFRKVEWLRVCHHVEGAPEPSSEPWP